MERVLGSLKALMSGSRKGSLKEMLLVSRWVLWKKEHSLAIQERQLEKWLGCRLDLLSGSWKGSLKELPLVSRWVLWKKEHS